MCCFSAGGRAVAAAGPHTPWLAVPMRPPVRLGPHFSRGVCPITPTPRRRRRTWVGCLLQACFEFQCLVGPVLCARPRVDTEPPSAAFGGVPTCQLQESPGPRGAQRQPLGPGQARATRRVQTRLPAQGGVPLTPTPEPRPWPGKGPEAGTAPEAGTGPLCGCPGHPEADTSCSVVLTQASGIRGAGKPLL